MFLRPALRPGTVIIYVAALIVSGFLRAVIGISRSHNRLRDDRGSPDRMTLGGPGMEHLPHVRRIHVIIDDDDFHHEVSNRAGPHARGDAGGDIGIGDLRGDHHGGATALGRGVHARDGKPIFLRAIKISAAMVIP